MDDSDEIMEFPLEFPVKIIGKDVDDFQSLVREILKPHIGTIESDAITRNESRSGTYLSLTLRFTATSREQLDAVYQTLSDHPKVLFSL